MKDNYLPALDGLRAVSILLVLLSHAGLEALVPGGLGVVMFFVISGFLITVQMIREIESTGTVNLPFFYIRRFLRLAPALFVYIALFSLLLTGLGAAITPMHVISGVFYFANYYEIFIGYPPHNPMPILWSLAVEEHFYILFPFIMLFFRRTLKNLLPWLLLVVAGIAAWRMDIALLCNAASVPAYCGMRGSERIFHATDTIADCILYGAIAALILQYYPRFLRRFCMHPFALPLAFTALIATLLYREPYWRNTLRFTMQSICIALIIVNLLYGKYTTLRSLLSHPFLVITGRLSYSLYLFHYGVLCLMNILQVSLHTPLGVTLYFSASFLLAALVYNFIEKPMLSLRQRFGSQRG